MNYLNIDNYSVNLLNLASDLHRVALALNEGSLQTAQVFEKQAREVIQSIILNNNSDYLNKLLSGIKQTLDNPSLLQKADDALMYSILLQNYVNRQK